MQDWDDIQHVLHANSRDEIVASATSYARKLGFQHFGYAVNYLNSASSTANVFDYLHDFGPNWAERYELLRRPEVQRDDPRVMQVCAGLPAAAWNSRGQISYTRSDIGRRARLLLQVAGEYGLRTGITVPCHSPGVGWAFMTFATDSVCDLREMGRLIAASAYFASCVHVAMDRLARRPQRLPQLTERERETLCWVALGKTSWEISTILSISERTVNFHLQGATRKLLARNRNAAVAQAVALGLIVL